VTEWLSIPQISSLSEVGEEHFRDVENQDEAVFRFIDFIPSGEAAKASKSTKKIWQHIRMEETIPPKTHYPE
jgi:hypothetical protein